MAARKAAVLEAVRKAIRESTNAARPTYHERHPFVETYGPGLKGITNGVKNGQFFIHASRFYRNNTHETVIVVSFILDTTHCPSQRSELDKTTREIVEAVEAEFHWAGARLHHESYDKNQEAPWRWFMTWVWDVRD